MRRKLILSGLAVCFAVAAIWYAFGSGMFTRTQGPAFLVPRDALMFAEQKNVGDLIDGFNASRLGRSLATIDIQKIASGTGLAAEQEEMLHQVFSTAKDLGSSAVVRKFCDDSLSFAVFAGTTDAVIADVKHSLPVQLLLVCRPKQNAGLLEMVSSAVTRDIRQEVISYGKNEISKFTSDGTTFYATVAQGFFLFAFDQSTLKQAIDTALQPDMSLAKRAEFQELRGQYQHTDFFMFTSPEAINVELQKYGQTSWPSGNLNGLRCSAYGIWREEGQFHDRSVTLIDRGQLAAANSRFLQNPPQMNDTLQQVPAEVQVYYWSNTLAPGLLLELLKEGGPDEKTLYTETVASFRELTGKDLEQVLAGIADGFSLQIHRGDTGGMLPIPSISVFFPVRDRAVIEEAMNTAFGNMGLIVQDQQYRNKAYRSCNFGLPGNIELVFGFIDGYLFFGSNRKMLESIIDTIENRKGLRESADFAAFVSTFEQPNNAVTYIKVSEILEGLKGLAGWAGALLAMENGELAGKSQVLVDGLLNPLFDGFSMISTAGTRTFFDQDRIVMESIYQVAPDTSTANQQQ